MSNEASDITMRVRGTIRTEDGSWDRGEVAIAGDRIASVSAGPRLDSGIRDGAVLDVGDSYVLPGAVDAHVHSLSSPGEGIAAATAAAAAGGVTTILEMPFDHSGPINSVDRLRAKQDLAAEQTHVDIGLLGTLDPAGGWAEADRLAHEGVVGFKASLFLTDSFRFPRTSDSALLDVMAATRDSGRTLCVHAENNEIIKDRIARELAAGSTDPQSHTRSRPPVSETLGVLTAMEVAASTGAALHLCHLSLPRSVELLSWYRSQGADISMETCPHYLTFTEEDLDRRTPRLKINPPLRDDSAREGLWLGLGSGAIPIIASDHAPWPTEKKDDPVMLDNSSGAPGVQTVVSVSLGQALHRDPGRQLFSRTIDALTLHPARRYGLDHRKGSLEAGKDADLMVFAASDAVAIQLPEQLSHAGWTPYEGMTPGGYISHTISRGRLVFTAENGLSAQSGDGEIVTL